MKIFLHNCSQTKKMQAINMITRLISNEGIQLRCFINIHLTAATSLSQFTSLMSYIQRDELLSRQLIIEIIRTVHIKLSLNK